MHVWGHEISSQTFCNKAGWKKSCWICDAVWQKAWLVLRTLCKTLAIGGPVSILSKVLLRSEGRFLGWEYALHRCSKSSSIKICEEKADQSPDISVTYLYLSLLILHRVNVSEKKHIKRSTFSVNLGKNTGLVWILFSSGDSGVSGSLSPVIKPVDKLGSG